MRKRRRRVPRLPSAMIVGITVALLSGCGSGESTTTVTTPASATTTEQALDPASAQRAVTQYYDEIDYYEYARAWQLLGSAQKAEDQGFKAWRSGYDLNMETNLRSAVAAAIDSDTVAVNIRLNTRDLDICGDNVPQTFEGTWTVESNDGRPYLSAADISKVGGGEPILAVADCPPDTLTAPPSTNQPYQPPSPEPIYGDDGSGYAPPTASDFCSYHDCIGDFENGNGSIVQCEDGSWSHSGGIQGACSWHGGVRGY